MGVGQRTDDRCYTTCNLIPHREGSSMSVVLLDLLLICVAVFFTGTMISVAILVD